MVNPIPEHYPRVMPYLSIDGASEAIDFYVKVLGATERMRMPNPDGTIGHAEIQLGDSVIMLSDPWPEGNVYPPKHWGGTPVSITVYVEDVDAVFAKALELGATELRAVRDEFYGDRSGSFADPFGHSWHVMSHVEDVSPEEMAERAAEAAAQAQ